MKNPILITLFCANLILVTPFTTIAREDIVGSNLPNQSDIDDLVAQVRVVIYGILENYGHIPMIKTLCSRIIGVLDTIGLVLFCVIFGFFVALPLAIIMLIMFFTGLTDSYLGQAIFFALFSIFFIWDFNCNFIAFPTVKSLSSLLNSISSLTELNDTSDLINKCPCLN
ncbi:MAG: hypothetical protein JSU91_05615 [Thermoplasmatales archaeon]|nr:MAG: hypothetical protein JSU91_05615 [Thermoplasmatales archaeon]